jgi:hypothetical protein
MTQISGHKPIFSNYLSTKNDCFVDKDRVYDGWVGFKIKATVQLFDSQTFDMRSEIRFYNTRFKMKIRRMSCLRQ